MADTANGVGGTREKMQYVSLKEHRGHQFLLSHMVFGR
jgi:hypothetical protein